MKASRMCLSLGFIIVLSGCVPSGIYLPEKFSTIKDVYPTGMEIDKTSDAPESSFRRESYPAPYADVFRLAEVSAVQNMMTIDSVNEDDGVILASKISPDPQPFERSQVCGALKNEVRYFYAIKVRELGATSTQVSLVGKSQGRCCYPGGTTVGGTVGSMMGVPFEEWKQKCHEFSSVHYADKPSEILQYFNFLRLNLLNAGLI